MIAIRIPSTAFLLAGIALAGGGVAAQAQTTVPRVTRLGSHKAYGPGIVAASTGVVRFDLVHDAHVVVLRVHPDGGIEPLLPQRPDEPTHRPAGSHAVHAPPVQAAAAAGARPLEPVLSPEALARAGTRARPPAAGADPEPTPTSYWWLVMVSDAPTGLDELLRDLEAFRARTFTTVEAEVRALPRALMAQGGRSWAAYFTYVEP